MEFGATYVPSPRSDFTELSRSATGRVFRKRILRWGKYPHPADPNSVLDINPAMASQLVQNFKDNVVDIVQVPVVDDKNAHSEDPFRNIGEVVDLTVDENGPDGPGVYAMIDARSKEAAESLANKTLLGASAMMHMNYRDTSTGAKVGPTLLHVAITNRPYITQLGDFEEVVAASADQLGEDIVVLSEEEDRMPTREELIQMLRDEHGIDVEDLQSRVAASAGGEDGPSQEFLVALSNVLKGAGATVPETQEITVQDVAEAVVEVAQDRVALAQEVMSLREENETRRRKEVEGEVDDLIRAARILPFQREAMVALAAGGEEQRQQFEALVAPAPIVSLSEEGVTTFEDTHEVNIDDEIARLSSVVKAEGYGHVKE